MHKSPFEPDPRNLGGRTTTANKMYGHQKALNTIKPTINNLEKPHEHVDAGKKKQPLLYKQIQTYGNVYKTFAAVGSTNKPMVNTKAPETMTYKHMNQNVKKPKLRTNKLNKFTEIEHQKHIESQQRRIKAISSLQERKKNPYDPQVNPVILFRRGDDKKGVNQYMKTQGMRSTQYGMESSMKSSKMSSESYVKEGGQRMQYSQNKQRPQTADMDEIRKYHLTKDVEKNKLKPVHDKNKKKHVFTKKENEEFARQQMEAEKELEPYDPPKTQNDEEEDYQYIKVRAVELIVKYRLFKHEDLKYLECQTINSNPHMELHKLEDIFQEIIDDLNR